MRRIASFSQLLAVMLAGPFCLSVSGRRRAADEIRLSALDLSAATQGWGNPRADRSVEGNPLTIGGRHFDHGFGTHADSRLVLDLKGSASRFTAWVGVDDEKKQSAGQRRVSPDRRRQDPLAERRHAGRPAGQARRGRPDRRQEAGPSGRRRRRRHQLGSWRLGRGDDRLHGGETGDPEISRAGRRPHAEAVAPAPDQRCEGRGRAPGQPVPLHDRRHRRKAHGVSGGGPARGPSPRPGHRHHHRPYWTPEASTASRSRPPTALVRRAANFASSSATAWRSRRPWAGTRGTASPAP